MVALARARLAAISAVTAALASNSYAQTEAAPGLTLAAPVTFDSDAPLWMVSDTRAATYETADRRVGCTDAPNVDVRGSLAGDYWIDSRLAVHPSTEALYVVSATYQLVADRPGVRGIQVTRADCGSMLEVLVEAREGESGFWNVEPSWVANRIALQTSRLPMRADGTLYLPTTEGIATWSIETPTAQPQSWVQAEAFRTAALASGLFRADEVPADPPAIFAMAPVDDGLVVHAYRQQFGGTFHVHTDGRVELLTSQVGLPAPVSLASVYGLQRGWAMHAELNSVIAWGNAHGFRAMGILPRDRTDLLAKHPRPMLPLYFDASPVFDGWVGGTGGAIYAAERPPGAHIMHRATLEVDRLDIDGDGLLGAEEATLGLDDRAWDHDRDGFSDGAERVLYGTDPASATSKPDVGFDVPTAGLTSLLSDWEPLPYRIHQGGFPGEPRIFTTASYGRGYFCYDGCYDRSGAKVCEDEDGYENWTASADGEVVYFDDEPLYSTPDVDPQQVVTAGELWSQNGFFPLSAEEVYSYGSGVGDEAMTVWRHTDERFAVFDPTRPECPLASSPADPRCNLGFETIPDLETIRLLGSTLDGGAIIGAVGRDRGPSLFAMNQAHVSPFADARIVPGERLRAVAPLPEHGAYLVEAYMGERDGYGVVHWYLADPNLVPYELVHEFYRDPPPDLGGRFVKGPLTVPAQVFAQNNGDLGSGSSFGCTEQMCFSDPGGPSMAFQTNHILVPSEVLAVDRRLQPGDVLLAGAPRRFVTDGFISRLTKDGALVEWLRMSNLEALSGGLVENMRPARSIAISPTADRLCLIEENPNSPLGVDGKLWEITIEDGVPTSMDLVVSVTDAHPMACGYDEDGKLFWGAYYALYDRDGKVMDTESSRPRHLHRIDGRWVLLGDLFNEGQAIDAPPTRNLSDAYCVGDDGESTYLGGQQALDVEGERVWVLDRDGVIDVMRADELCKDERSITERVLAASDKVNIWSMAFDGMLGVAGRFASAEALAFEQIWRVRYASLVVRPDKLLLVAGGPVWRGRGPLPPNFVWRARGAYWPTTYERFTDLDALRREQAMVNVASVSHFATAMVKVPGASSWPVDAYQISDAPPPRDLSGPSTSTPDAGLAPDAGTPEGSARDEGCLCKSPSLREDFSLIGAAFVVSLWLSRRRHSNTGAA